MGRPARRRSAKRRRMRPYTTVEGLLDAAKRHALHSTAAPSLRLPFRTAALRPTHNYIKVVRQFGRGAVAARNLPAGTTLVCEKALAMVLDAQIDEAVEEEDAENADGALLILRLAARLVQEPSFEAELFALFPRTDAEVDPLRPWRCSHDGLQRLVETALATLDESLARRLPHLVRYNAVSCETGGDLYAYGTSPEALLSGIALYRDSSVFNHSAAPNVARWHAGDVACFRTNRAVEAGEPLTVSYVASPLLPDAPAVNGALEHFDFGGGARTYPSIDPDAQDALMMLPPADRLKTIADISGRDAEASATLFTDRLELTIQKAAALQESGDASGAAEAWLAALLSAAEWLPPNDEQVAAIGVQCAKAIAHADGLVAGRAVLQAAYASHAIAFAPGVRLFAKRYEGDLLLPPAAPGELLGCLL